jgi:tetratricopeptide (TPR) repeat protein
MNENYTLEELEAYLHGELPVERAKKLEEEIKTDLALQSELEALKITREAIELAGWKTMIQQAQSEYLADREQETKVKPIQGGTSGLFVWTKRIAASLTILLVGLGAYLMVSVSPESITSDQIEYQIPVMRSSENTLTAIQEAYRQKDYQGVIAISEKAATYNAEFSFLTGLSYLEVGEWKKAEASLLQIEASNQQNESDEFADQVDYYLVKIYLSSNQIDQASDRIHKILKDEQHTYHGNFGKMDLIRLAMLKFKN